MATRKPAVSNRFYPGNPALLRQNIMGFVDNAKLPAVKGKIKALIVPHAGYVYSGQVAAYGYKILKSCDKSQKWKILVMGPDHKTRNRDAVFGGFSEWETPLGPVTSKSLKTYLPKSDYISEIANTGLTEHSIEVQLPFLQCVLNNFDLYPVYVGEVDHEALAEELIPFCKDANSITIVSTDLSHYLPREKAENKDKSTLENILSLKSFDLKGKNLACGLEGVSTLIFLARKLNWKPVLLNYKTSGEYSGDDEEVVGYASIAFVEETSSEKIHTDYGESKGTEDELSALADYPFNIKTFLLATARNELIKGFGLTPKALKRPKRKARLLFEEKGVFVTLESQKRLRGCVGKVIPSENDTLESLVKEMALSAAFEDSRFFSNPLTEADLSNIKITVSILSTPKKIEFEDPYQLVKMLTPKRDGVIIKKDDKSAIFLPEVWEHYKNPQVFLSALCSKAGLANDAWLTEKTDVYKFLTSSFTEK